MKKKKNKNKKKMAGVSRETQMSIEASSMFPGFRFSPTDVELISFYLKKKMEGSEKCVEVISEIEICRYEPWDLPGSLAFSFLNLMLLAFIYIHTYIYIFNF